MKKAICLTFALLIALFLTGCGEKKPDLPDKSAETALQSIMDKSGTELGEEGFPPVEGMALTTNDLDDEGVNFGITPAQFGDYVSEAYISKALFTTSPFEVALFKCKDAEAALAVKNAIADNYFTGKWVCVFPKQAFTADAGQYVLLAATEDTHAPVIQKYFAEEFGVDAGNVNKFYTFE